MKILVVNGANLNMLGAREPSLYGVLTLGDIERKIKEAAGSSAIVSFFQSNHEGALVDRVHRAFDEQIDYIIINAGAYTHSSIALRDAFLATGIEFIEVHLSNIYSRETYRHKSLLADLAIGVIAGFKENSYILALAHILSISQQGRQGKTKK